MATLLTRLFPSRKETVRKAARTSPAARQPAKARLGLEAMDARELPSVTAALNNGVLAVTADNYNTTAFATQIGSSVIVMDDYHGIVGTYNTANISKLVYTGGSNPSKTDNFFDTTGLASDLNPGAAGGTIVGGWGVNTFHADANTKATLNAGVGTNVLYRTGGDAFLHVPNGGSAGTILAPGLVTGTPTPDRLSATGNLTVSLQGNNELVINGPSGIGFQLGGSWSDSWNHTTGAHTFTAKGPVTLQTGSVLGDIPITATGGLQVTTKASSVDLPFGEFSNINLAGLSLTSGGSSNALNSLGSQYGLSFQLPGQSWGLALGSKLGSLGIPLNSAVPYLFYSMNTSASASFGGVTVSPSGGHSFSVAIDPADPSIAVKYGDFGVGLSYKGEIPYVPNQLPDGISDPQIHGNIWATGAVDLGDLPASLSGSVVIDLDANGDGKLAGMSAADLQKLLHGQESLKDAAAKAAGDIEVGVNGEIDFSLDQYGINLTAPLGTASAFYTPALDGAPALLAFRGASVNPFAGTVLEKFSPLSTFDVQGYINSNKDWSFKAETGTGNFFGFSGNSLEFDASSATHKVHAHASLGAMLGLAEISLDGSIDWTTGDFDLVQTASLTIDAKVCSVGIVEIFDLSYHNGTLLFNVTVFGGCRIGTSDWNVHAGFYGNLTLTVDSQHHVQIHGSAGLSVGVTLDGHSYDKSLLSFEFDNDGFEFDVCGHGVRVDW